MSDLANSCEYLTIDKTCSAVLESEKGKANRQLRCQSEEKLSCCYLCLSRRECSLSCKFLGSTGSEVSSVGIEKTEPQSAEGDDRKTEVPQMENPQATYCPSCNLEMSQTRTKFRIDGWSGKRPELSGDDSEELAVTVYLCPQCGKVEFRAASN